VTQHRSTPPTDARAPRGELVVSLAGELDLMTLPSLSELLASTTALERTDLVVDLAEVTFMDAASAGLLVRTGALLAERACGLVLRSAQPMVHRVLVLFGATEAQVGCSPAPKRPLVRAAGMA